MAQGRPRKNDGMKPPVVMDDRRVDALCMALLRYFEGEYGPGAEPPVVTEIKAILAQNKE